MKDIPILYSTPMVRSIFDDLKSQTRRPVKWRGVAEGLNLGFSGLGVERIWCAANGEPSWVLQSPSRTSNEWRSKPTPCPYGQPGDRHWVRETFFAWGRWITRFNPKKCRDEWHFIDLTLEAGKSYLYVADGFSDMQAFQKRRGGVEPMYWKRPAIFMPRAACRLLLTVTGVSVERLQEISDADAIAEGIKRSTDGIPICNARQWYQVLWEQINGPGSWDLNPWVWVVEFRRLAL